MDGDCTFCLIRDGQLAAHKVLDEGEVIAFLDTRPLFPGHVLVVPRTHHATLSDLPPAQVPTLFIAVQRLCSAVTAAVGADGSFVAVNNAVSQSVPHLHVHVVPRRRGDGLKGFFWPRSRYAGEPEMAEVARRIREAVSPSPAVPPPPAAEPGS